MRLVWMFIFIFTLHLINFFVSAEASASEISMSSAAAQYPKIVYRKGCTAEKNIALTFDDSPDAFYTPAILDILKENNIKATFFLIGRKAQAYPQITKRIIDEGHVIANHSWDHSYLSKLPPKDIANQIVNTDKTIYDITGTHTKLFRPPYGALSDEVIKTSQNLGYNVILWSVDSNDWRGYSSSRVLKNILGSVTPGSIILQHCNNQGTLKSLDKLINNLQQQGYALTTVPQLLKTQNKNLIKLVVNGKKITKPTYPTYLTESNRVMAPLKPLMNLLGYQTIIKKDNTISMEIPGIMNFRFNKNIANIFITGNTIGIKVDMEESITIMQNNVMVPVRAMAELLGVKIEWDGERKTVKLSQPRIYKKTNL